MKLIVLAFLATFTLSSSTYADSCLERFVESKDQVSKNFFNRIGNSLVRQGTKISGQNRTGKLLVLSQKIVKSEVNLPVNTIDELESAMIYGNLARTFLKLKEKYNQFEVSVELTNVQFAQALLDLDIDPLSGNNPFCFVNTRRGTERLNMRIYKKNRGKIAQEVARSQKAAE